jgi:hypothetical protein
MFLKSLFISFTLCGLYLIPETKGIKLKGSAPPDCPDEGQHFFPDPEDCQAYYHCSFGVPHHQRCPDGTLWNQEIKACDLPENVECDLNPTTPSEASTVVVETTSRPTTNTPIPTTPEGPTRPPNPCPPEGVVFIPVEGSCQDYILCVDGEPHPRRCPDGLLFDPIELKCKPKDEVDCGKVTNPTSSPSTPSQPETSANPDPSPTTPNPGDFHCPAGVPFIYMPHPDTCTLFYWCEFGEFKGISNCGVDLWFSFLKQACVNPYESECDKESRPPTPAPEN